MANHKMFLVYVVHVTTRRTFVGNCNMANHKMFLVYVVHVATQRKFVGTINYAEVLKAALNNRVV